MKKTTIMILLRLFVLGAVLLSFTGCSDMMQKLGNISLTIVLDTPDVAVASYRLDGLHTNANSRFSLSDITPPRHSLSSLRSGTWTITVTAFDAGGDQIGIGTKSVDLKEGQIVETTLLVVFNQAAPTSSGFTFSAPTRFDSCDGILAGTTPAMEYRLASEPEGTPYTVCTAGSTILGSDTYLVRYAAAHGLRASDPLRITVPRYEPIQLTIGDPVLTASKVYDGTTDVRDAVTLGDLNGVRETDTVTVSARTTYDDKSVGSGKTITVTYTLDGNDAGNYIKPVNKAVTGSIEKKPLTISGTTIAATKVYDRSPLIAITSPGLLGGVLGTDEVTVTPSASCSDSNAGSDKQVTITYTLGGSDAGNYQSPVNNTILSSTITAKPLTVSGTVPTLDKQYDGNTSAQVQTSGNIVGVEPGDAVNLQITATYADHRVGTGIPLTVSYAISGDTANYLVPENAMFNGGQIIQKQLTVSNLALSSSKEYDGTTSVETPTFSIDGKVLSEDVRVTATATYASAAAGTGKQISVAYALEGDDKGNYLKPSDSIASSSGIITKKHLSVSGTFLVLNKVYDGNATAAITASGTLQGVMAGDTVSFSAVATYDSITAGESKSVTVVYSLGGDGTANYFKPANAVHTGVIQKRQLQVTTPTTVATTKTYDRTQSAQITQYSSLSGVVPGDSITLATSAAYAAKHAGTDTPIWVYYTIDGADTINYLKPADVLATNQGVITKKQLTASGTTITANKVYDGTTSVAVGSHGLLAGVVAGDAVSLQATATYDTKAVGTDKSIAITYTLIGTDMANYFKPVDTIATETGEISHKQLMSSILGDIPTNKVYDGTTSATAPSFSLIGKVPTDTVTVTATAMYDSAAAGIGKRITIGYSLSGIDKDNYLKPADILTTATCSITKKLLTISPPVLETTTKDYDGTAAVAGTVTPGSLSGVLAGDVVTVGAAASYQSANVTNLDDGFNPITVIYSLSGSKASNYAPPVNATRWGAIGRKQLSVSNTTFPASKVYDKTSAITITSWGTLSGVIGDDTVILSNVVAYYSGTYSDHAGTDKAVTINYTISGTDANNYSLNSDSSRKASITNALLIATVGDYTQQYGAAAPTFVVNVTGFVGGDSATSLVGYIPPTATAGTNSSSAAGTYTISISGGNAPNYSFNTNNTGTLTIVKPAGPAISDSITGYFPASPASQSVINFTGFSTNLTNLEASVAIDGSTFGSYADIAVDSRNRAMLVPASAATTDTRVRIRVKETTLLAAGQAKEIALTSQALAIGDYYQGGIVAYFFVSWDPGYISGQVHGLIAATSDVSSAGVPWSNSTTTIVGTSSGIGAGLNNTSKIVTSIGSSASSYAAGMARNYRGGGYTDWFLPSKDELFKMRLVFVAIGDFATPASFYWSSTEEKGFSREETVYTGDTVHAIEFDPNSGNTIMVSNSLKTYAYSVRPVRNF